MAEPQTIFFTGFPGFLGSELLPRLLGRAPERRAVCLVQDKFLSLAERRRDELARRQPDLEGRVDLVVGDITRPGLGLGEAGVDVAGLQDDTVEIWHLAAVYDLGVSREVGEAVNVRGTRHVLDFAEACDGLQRFQYVSTCYVSGRYDGVFHEADLIRGQSFNNFYDETKYLAEVDVQERMAAGLPATIYRPSIVTGDSETGATQKYDGPFFIIRWLLRQPKALAFLPVPGDPTHHQVNVVPRDVVLDAITHLSGLEASRGVVYQVADPAPPTVAETIDVLAEVTGRRVVRVPLPKGLAKGSLKYVPGVHALMGIPPEAVDYFVHPTRYDTRNTLRDLEGSDIILPSFPTYADRLVAFMKEHPEISSDAMV